MNTQQISTPYLIYGSLLIALLLSVIPMPDWSLQLRPQWLALVLIYWCLMAPEKVGIATAWICGLLLDVLTGSLLGAHAMSLALIAFIALQIHQRARIFPLWQQSLVVVSLLALEHALQFWIIGITRDATPGLEYWFTPVIGLLIWPWLFILLSEIQHRVRS